MGICFFPGNVKKGQKSPIVPIWNMCLCVCVCVCLCVFLSMIVFVWLLLNECEWMCEVLLEGHVVTFLYVNFFTSSMSLSLYFRHMLQKERNPVKVTKVVGLQYGVRLYQWHPLLPRSQVLSIIVDFTFSSQSHHFWWWLRLWSSGSLSLGCSFSLFLLCVRRVAFVSEYFMFLRAFACLSGILLPVFTNNPDRVEGIRVQTIQDRRGRAKKTQFRPNIPYGFPLTMEDSLRCFIPLPNHWIAFMSFCFIFCQVR